MSEEVFAHRCRSFIDKLGVMQNKGRIDESGRLLYLWEVDDEERLHWTEEMCATLMTKNFKKCTKIITSVKVKRSYYSKLER